MRDAALSANVVSASVKNDAVRSHALRDEGLTESLPSPSRALAGQLQFGATVEHRVIADKRQAPPDGGCRYPKVSGLHLLAERVARVLARTPQTGERCRGGFEIRLRRIRCVAADTRVIHGSGDTHRSASSCATREFVGESRSAPRVLCGCASGERHQAADRRDCNEGCSAATAVAQL